MDEPQITDQVDSTDAVAEKSDLSEVLESAFAGDESEKPMEVDEVGKSDEPGTSAEPALIEDVETIEDTASEPVEEDAGQSQDVSMAEKEPDQSVEQVMFDNPSSDLDETAQSTIANDTLDFTEQSINISQLNVEHHDDSNDAFNALKESETDALQEPKEETSEPKEPEEGVETAEPETVVEKEVGSDKEPESDKEEASTETQTPMETADVEPSGEKEDGSPAADVDQTVDESREIGTETLDLEDNDDSIGGPVSNEKPDNDEDAEENADGEYCKVNL